MSKSPRKIALVTLDLHEFLVTTEGVSEERWVMLESTFNALYRVASTEKQVLLLLSDLLAFFKAPKETKELMAGMSMNYHFKVDNLLVLAMNNADDKSSDSYTPNDIVGFTLGHKDKGCIRLSQCMVQSDYRRHGYGAAMIRYLCTSMPHIERVKVDVRSELVAIQFFASLGFMPQKNEYATHFTSIAANHPENILHDPFIASIRQENGTLPLIYYSSFCRTCKEVIKPTKRCGRCFTVSYCSNTCQRQDWSSHQLHCKPNVLSSVNK